MNRLPVTQPGWGSGLPHIPANRQEETTPGAGEGESVEKGLWLGKGFSGKENQVGQCFTQEGIGDALIGRRVLMNFMGPVVFAVCG